MSGRRKTIAAKHLSRAEVSAGKLLVIDEQRPQTRAECPPHPCPWVSCRFHLGVDVSDAGSLILNHPAVAEGDLTKLPDTCVLDVAERGGATLEDVGERFGVSRERIRQMEERALLRLRLHEDDLEAIPALP